MKFSNIIVLSLVVCVLGCLVSQGQVPEAGDHKLVRAELIAELIAKKGSKDPLVLLTPSDLSELSTTERNTLLDGGDPCESAQIIDFGQTVNGLLQSSDCQLEDGSYADFYAFNGTATQQVTINLSSTAFDTYLGLANETGSFVVEDNDGGGGTNSRIVASLPQTGFYIILANSWLPNQFGTYSIDLTGSSVCSYSLTPTSASIPGAGGTFSFTVNTQPGCSWSTSYNFTFVNFVTSGGTGTGTVSYTVSPNNTGADRSTIIRVNNTNIFTINQTFLTCTYSISPTTADHSPDAATAEFMMNTQTGCPWIAQYDAFWIWTSTELHYGPGPVPYTVPANNGAAERTGHITLAGQTFTIRQAGRNCTYSVSPTNVVAPAAGMYMNFTVDTQPGCTWNFYGNFNYIDFPDGYSGTGPGTKLCRIYQNINFAPRTWATQFYGLEPTIITFNQAGVPYRNRVFDYDGDGKTDISVFRPSTGMWYLHRSQAGFREMQFGLATDKIVPADYDGDRVTDIAVFRPSSGVWYITNSANETFTSLAFGTSEDIPAPSDYDGDGRADIAVFRPSQGTWYIRNSSNGSFTIMQFGQAGDAPTVGDFSGDGKADIAVYRPSTSVWYQINSANGAFTGEQFGMSTDKIVPGAYDPDQVVDIAVYRPSEGRWYIKHSYDYSYHVYDFGLETDIPAPGDYDNDGKWDIAVFRPSDGFWYIANTSNGSLTTLQFGQNGDQPTQSAFSH